MNSCIKRFLVLASVPFALAVLPACSAHVDVPDAGPLPVLNPIPAPDQKDSTAQFKSFLEQSAWCGDFSNTIKRTVHVEFQDNGSKLVYQETQKSGDGTSFTAGPTDLTWSAQADATGSWTNASGQSMPKAFEKVDESSIEVIDILAMTSPTSTPVYLTLTRCTADVATPPAPPAPPVTGPSTPTSQTVQSFKSMLIAMPAWCGNLPSGDQIYARFLDNSAYSSQYPVMLSGSRSGASNLGFSDGLSLTDGGKGQFQWTTGSIEYVSETEIRVTDSSLTNGQTVAMQACNN